MTLNGPLLMSYCEILPSRIIVNHSTQLVSDGVGIWGVKVASSTLILAALWLTCELIC